MELGLGLSLSLAGGGGAAHFTSFFKQYIDPTNAGTITGSPVSEIRSPNTDGFTTKPPRFQQSTSTARPAITASRLVFDGTTDYLNGSAGYDYLSATTMADPFYAEAGKGPTCTGLARASDGTWWVGHFGKKNETTAGSETFDGSIIHYSADFSTIIQEIRFQSLSLANVGIQGVCIDPATGVVYCADIQNGKIYGITPSGPTLTYNFTLASANGLAFDTINNRLIASDNTATLKYVNKTTGTNTTAFTVRDADNLDHLFFAASYGSAGALYTTGRGNNTPGRVIKYDLANNVHVKAWSIVDTQTIEGLVVVDNTLYLCDDAYYHNAPAAINRVVTARVDASTPDYGTRLILAGVVKIAATPAATVALCHGGDGINRKGAGLFFTVTANQFRLIARGSGAQATIDWAITSTTTEFIYYMDINTVANTATLYVNGTLVSSQNSALLAGALPMLAWTLGASYENTGLATRFAAVTIGGFIVTTNADIQDEIEGFLAWKTGNQGLLPIGHTYKNSAPP